MTDKEKILHLCDGSGYNRPKQIVTIAGGGSNRRYYRLVFDGMTKVAAVCDNPDEAEAFVKIGNALAQHGLPVPVVEACDSVSGTYIMDDLEDISLFSILHTPQADKLIRESVSTLVRAQNLPCDLWRNIGLREFGHRQVMWDLYYFKYCFLKPLGIEFNEERLEDDFENFTAKFLPFDKDTTGYMYRDFQSRNVMVFKGHPKFIDFQGAWIGPGVYDMISFLWQAKASFSQEYREEILNFYFNEMSKFRNADSIEKMRNQVTPLAFLRTFQVLGAYGFRGLIEKKAHFIESIPKGLDNLRQLIESNPGYLGEELETICNKLLSANKFNRTKSDNLTISVYSFSYKKGYPEDITGNGGGFMFDCRGMENPGRYERFKTLTGRDLPVIEFLESKGEIQVFLENAIRLVSPSVENYIERGFSNLQIGFGCTGGQHRSVYCADHMAQYLRKSFPGINVRLIHREQGIEE